MAWAVPPFGMQPSVPVPGQPVGMFGTPAPTGWLGGLSNALTNNQAALMGMASGLFSGAPGMQGMGVGLQNAMVGMQVDQKAAQARREEQERQATAAALQKWIRGQKLSPEVSDVLNTNPSLARSVFENAITPKETKYEKVGEGDTLIDPRTRQVIYQGPPKLTAVEQQALRLYPNDPDKQREFVERNAGRGVTINNAAETSFDREMGQSNAKVLQNIIEQGNQAASAIPTLNRMEALTQDRNFYSGIGGDAALQLKRGWAAVTGNPEIAKSTEEFNSLAAQDTLKAIGGSLGAQISNSDRDFIMRTTANLGNTSEGNRAVIAMRKRVAERQAEVARMAADYVQQNKRFDQVDFNRIVRQYAEQNPLFPEAQQQRQPAGGSAADPLGLR